MAKGKPASLSAGLIAKKGEAVVSGIAPPIDQVAPAMPLAFTVATGRPVQGSGELAPQDSLRSAVAESAPQRQAPAGKDDRTALTLKVDEGTYLALQQKILESKIARQPKTTQDILLEALTNWLENHR